MSQRATHVVVLGGGISGLTATWSLMRMAKKMAKPVSITLLESSNRYGGWLHSKRIKGHLFENGCRGIRPQGSGVEAMRMLEELGLQNEALPADGTAKGRYILYKGKLTKLPDSLAGAIASPLTRSFPLWAIRDIFAFRSIAPTSTVNGTSLSGNVTDGDRDESVHDFMCAQFGPFVTNVLLDAAFSGIYAGDLRQLSARALLPSLWELRESGKWWGNRRGSVLVGKLRSIFQNYSSKSGAAKEEDNNTSTDTIKSLFPTTDTLSPFVERCTKSSSVSFIDGMSALPRGIIRNLLLQPNAYEGTISGYLDKQGKYPMDQQKATVESEKKQARMQSVRIFHSAPVTQLLTKDMLHKYTANDANDAVNLNSPSMTVLQLDGSSGGLRTSATLDAMAADSVSNHAYFVRIGSSGEYLLPCDVVIASAPASSLASILKSTLSSLPSTIQSYSSLTNAVSLLQSIPYASIGVTSIAWSRALLNRLQQGKIRFPSLDGFGYLVPKVERGTSLPEGSDLTNTTFSPSHLPPNILGMVWDSSVFPQQSPPSPTYQNGSVAGKNPAPSNEDSAEDYTDVRISVMMGGATNNNVTQVSTTELREIAVRTCTTHLDVPKAFLEAGCSATFPEGALSGSKVEREESMLPVFNCSVAVNAIPQYTVGHRSRVRGIEKAIEEVYGEHVHILGNSYYGIGVADCVKNAMELGVKVMNNISSSEPSEDQ